MRRERRERAGLLARPRTWKGRFPSGRTRRCPPRRHPVAERVQAAPPTTPAHERAVPRLIELPRLLRAIDHLDTEGTLKPGTRGPDRGRELTGRRTPQRPRSSTCPADSAIAKFPRTGSDEWDVEGWEEVELRLARRAGIDVAGSELVQVVGDGACSSWIGSTGRDGKRTGFASALTMLEAADGEQHSYLEIADTIERHSPRPTADLQELYRRIIFSVLTANTDDHLRNHAFLRIRTRLGAHMHPLTT